MNITRFFARAGMTLLLAMLTTMTSWAWDGQGTETDPYLIKTKTDWDHLADCVNGTNGETANDFSETFFKLNNTIRDY